MQKVEPQHGKTPQRQPAAKQAKVASVESPQGGRIAQLEAMMDGSPRQAAQRKKFDNLFGTAQRAADDEPIQGKFNTVQRLKDEEPLQGKFATAQRVEDEESLQGKFSAASTAQIEPQPAKDKPNNTGLPDNLKSGIENLSGMSMDNVKVHYNSSQPAQLNALAYAQGTDIHVAPGQEKHLPHEAWHVVQQAQGRVQPTMQMKGGVPVNDDKGLEHEADVMGMKALANHLDAPSSLSPGGGKHVRQAAIQRYTEEDNNIKLSTNRKFAVQNEGKNGKLFISEGVGLPKLQHVELAKGGEKAVCGVTMNEVIANFENEEAMNEMFCGKFSHSVTGITENKENENAPVGRSLYTNNVTHDGIDNGWKNHYAPVILADDGDRGTLETAAGITYCWFGIYGKSKGQTFRYKTQYASIIRNMTQNWVDEETGHRILDELNKYKNNEIENDESLHAYTLKEVLKLRTMANAEPAVLDEKLPVETDTPYTKQQSNEITRRNINELERRSRNKTILKTVLGLGAAALTILAGWYFFG